MAPWPYTEEKSPPKFLLKRETSSNRLELQEDCLRLIETELAFSNANQLAFISVVGPRKTGKTEMLIAMRNHLLGLTFSNQPVVAPAAHKVPIATDRDEGILLLSTPAVKTSKSSQSSKICFFALDIWAPKASDGNYALLVDFCLLASSHVVFIERFPGKREFNWPGRVTALPQQPGKITRQDLPQKSPKQKRVQVLLKDFDAGVNAIHNFPQLIQGKTTTFSSLRFLTSIWPTEKVLFIRTNIQARKYVHTLMSSVSAIHDVRYTIPKSAYAEFLKDTLTRCSNPKPYKPSQGNSIPEGAHSAHQQSTNIPDQVKEQIAAATLLKFQTDFDQLVQPLKKILFLEDPVLDSEFRQFVNRVTKASFKDHQEKIPSDVILEEIIRTAFNDQFQDFKRQYHEQGQKTTELDAKLTARLESIENEMFDSCIKENMGEFQAQLKVKYRTHLENFNTPCKDFHLLPQWQLRCQKRFDHHAKCLKDAVSGIQQTEDSLNTQFSNHLEDPEKYPLPNKASIKDAGDLESLPTLTRILHDCLEEVYQRALKRYQHVKVQVEENNRAFREQAAKMYRQQVNQGKRAKTPDIIIVKKNRF